MVTLRKSNFESRWDWPKGDYVEPPAVARMSPTQFRTCSGLRVNYESSYLRPLTRCNSSPCLMRAWSELDRPEKDRCWPKFDYGITGKDVDPFEKKDHPKDANGRLIKEVPLRYTFKKNHIPNQCRGHCGRKKSYFRFRSAERAATCKDKYDELAFFRRGDWWQKKIEKHTTSRFTGIPTNEDEGFDFLNFYNFRKYKEELVAAADKGIMDQNHFMARAIIRFDSFYKANNLLTELKELWDNSSFEYNICFTDFSEDDLYPSLKNVPQLSQLSFQVYGDPKVIAEEFKCYARLLTPAENVEYYARKNLEPELYQSMATYQDEFNKNNLVTSIYKECMEITKKKIEEKEEELRIQEMAFLEKVIPEKRSLCEAFFTRQRDQRAFDRLHVPFQIVQVDPYLFIVDDVTADERLKAYFVYRFLIQATEESQMVKEDVYVDVETLDEEGEKTYPIEQDAFDPEMLEQGDRYVFCQAEGEVKDPDPNRQKVEMKDQSTQIARPVWRVNCERTYPDPRPKSETCARSRPFKCSEDYLGQCFPIDHYDDKNCHVNIFLSYYNYREHLFELQKDSFNEILRITSRYLNELLKLRFKNWTDYYYTCSFDLPPKSEPEKDIEYAGYRRLQQLNSRMLNSLKVEHTHSTIKTLASMRYLERWEDVQKNKAENTTTSDDRLSDVPNYINYAIPECEPDTVITADACELKIAKANTISYEPSFHPSCLTTLENLDKMDIWFDNQSEAYIRKDPLPHDMTGVTYAKAKEDEIKHQDFNDPFFLTTEYIETRKEANLETESDNCFILDRDMERLNVCDEFEQFTEPDGTPSIIVDNVFDSRGMALRGLALQAAISDRKEEEAGKLKNLFACYGILIEENYEKWSHQGSEEVSEEGSDEEEIDIISPEIAIVPESESSSVVSVPIGDIDYIQEFNQMTVEADGEQEPEEAQGEPQQEEAPVETTETVSEESSAVEKSPEPTSQHSSSIQQPSVTTSPVIVAKPVVQERVELVDEGPATQEPQRRGGPADGLPKITPGMRTHLSGSAHVRQGEINITSAATVMIMNNPNIVPTSDMIRETAGTVLLTLNPNEIPKGKANLVGRPPKNRDGPSTSQGSGPQVSPRQALNAAFLTVKPSTSRESDPRRRSAPAQLPQRILPVKGTLPTHAARTAAEQQGSSRRHPRPPILPQHVKRPPSPPEPRPKKRIVPPIPQPGNVQPVQARPIIQPVVQPESSASTTQVETQARPVVQPATESELRQVVKQETQPEPEVQLVEEEIQEPTPEIREIPIEELHPDLAALLIPPQEPPKKRGRKKKSETDEPSPSKKKTKKIDESAEKELDAKATLYALQIVKQGKLREDEAKEREVLGYHFAREERDKKKDDGTPSPNKSIPPNKPSPASSSTPQKRENESKGTPSTNKSIPSNKLSQASSSTPQKRENESKGTPSTNKSIPSNKPSQAPSNQKTMPSSSRNLTPFNHNDYRIDTSQIYAQRRLPNVTPVTVNPKASEIALQSSIIATIANTIAQNQPPPPPEIEYPLPVLTPVPLTPIPEPDEISPPNQRRTRQRRSVAKPLQPAPTPPKTRQRVKQQSPVKQPVQDAPGPSTRTRGRKSIQNMAPPPILVTPVRERRVSPETVSLGSSVVPSRASSVVTAEGDTRSETCSLATNPKPKKVWLHRNLIENQAETSPSENPESPEVQYIPPEPVREDESPDIVILEDERTFDEIKREALDALDNPPEPPAPSYQIIDDEYDVDNMFVPVVGAPLITACDYLAIDRDEEAHDLTPFAPEPVRIDALCFYQLLQNMFTGTTRAVLFRMTDRYAPFPEEILTLVATLIPRYLTADLHRKALLAPTEFVNYALAAGSKPAMQVLTRNPDPELRKKQYVTSQKIKELFEYFLSFRKDRLEELKEQAFRNDPSSAEIAKLTEQFDEAMDRVQLAMCDSLLGLSEESKDWEPTMNTLQRRYETLVFGWRAFIVRGYPIKLFYQMFAGQMHARVEKVIYEWNERFDELIKKIKDLMEEGTDIRVHTLVEVASKQGNQHIKKNWERSLLNVRSEESSSHIYCCCRETCNIWFSDPEFFKSHKALHEFYIFECLLDWNIFHHKLSIYLHFIQRHLKEVLSGELSLEVQEVDR